MKHLLDITLAAQNAIDESLGEKPFVIVGGTRSGKSMTTKYLIENYQGTAFNSLEESNELRTDQHIAEYLKSGNTIAEAHTEFLRLNKDDLKASVALKCMKLESGCFSVDLA